MERTMLDDYETATLHKIAKDGTKRKSELYSTIPQQKKLEKMIETGLVEESKKNRYNVKEIHITEKGKKALKAAETLQRILKNEQ